MTVFTVLDAPIDSSGAGRGEEHAPADLRAAGLLERIGARDEGEANARLRDTRRDPATGVIAADQVRRASSTIASRVAGILANGDRPLVIGGDCTLLLGVFAAVPDRCGLWFVDGHADFYDGESSPTGEAADMDLAILTGHGPEGLLGGGGPLLDPAGCVLLGHRPGTLSADTAIENARIDPAIHAVTAPEIRRLGAAELGADARARLACEPAWLHIDLDVLDQEVLPAVSYLQPLGLDWDQLLDLTRPLAAAPNLAGVSLTDFNPDCDHTGTWGDRVIDFLESLIQAET